jgi:hypothetical protein
VATWPDVLRLALVLPGAEQSTHYGKPAVKVGGRFFTCMSSHEPGALVVPCPAPEARLLCASLPDVYYLTPHYEGGDAVLARLDAIDEEELAGRVEDAYAHVVAKYGLAPVERS